jgi:H+/Cl- antiporter ClcA
MKSYEKIKNFSLRILPYWLAASLTALVSVFYARAFAWSEDVARDWGIARPELSFLIIPLALLVSAEMARIFVKFASGSGIPQLIAAVEISHNEESPPLLKQLLSIPVIVTKLVGSCLCVAGGGITGREGPMLQISAGIFYWIQQKWPVKSSKLSLQSMILAGGAAGLASAFNTPLGGIIFAIEELAKVHISRVRTVIFHSVIIAGLLAQAFLGNYLYIGRISIEQSSNQGLWALCLASIVIGGLGAFFGMAFVKANDFRVRLGLRWQILMTLLCGVVVAGIFYFQGVSALGSGRSVIIDLLTHSKEPASLSLAFSRAFGNYFTYIGGVIGGIFAPALSTGAAFGSWFSQFVPGANPQIWILAGMISFLTGVTRTPFTSLILVLEMTDSHSSILYLMLAAILAQAGAYLLDSVSFYEQMARRIIAKG